MYAAEKAAAEEERQRAKDFHASIKAEQEAQKAAENQARADAFAFRHDSAKGIAATEGYSAGEEWALNMPEHHFEGPVDSSSVSVHPTIEMREAAARADAQLTAAAAANEGSAGLIE